MKWAAYALRLPPDMKLLLERKAVENDRSLNKEIVARLRATLTSYTR